MVHVPPSCRQNEYSSGAVPPVAPAVHVIVVPAAAGSGLFDVSDTISNNVLLRERVANNVALAGDQQLTELAYRQNIVVTVAGNTRFYIVLESGAREGSRAGAPAATSVAAGSRGPTVPSVEELRQLLQLKQELSAMYQQASTPSTANQAPQQ